MQESSIAYNGRTFAVVRIINEKTDTMNKTDLRLGNLVEYPCWNKDGTSAYFKVRDIFWEDDKLALTNGIIQLPQTRLEYIRPIQLSVEWLEKLGFQNVSNLYFYHSDFCCKIEKLSNRWAVRFVVAPKESITITYIHYVHQLQNLFYVFKNEELSVSI